MEPTTTKRRRTNEEILAEFKAEKAKPKEPRKRRTKAEIERDRRIAEDQKLKEELENSLTYKVVEFYDEVNAFGYLRHSGDVVKLKPNSYEARLAYDANNNFILDKSPEEQLKLWGKVKYVVREESVV